MFLKWTHLYEIIARLKEDNYNFSLNYKNNILVLEVEEVEKMFFNNCNQLTHSIDL